MPAPSSLGLDLICAGSSSTLRTASASSGLATSRSGALFAVHVAVREAHRSLGVIVAHVVVGRDPREGFAFGLAVARRGMEQLTRARLVVVVTIWSRALRHAIPLLGVAVIRR